MRILVQPLVIIAALLAGCSAPTVIEERQLSSSHLDLPTPADLDKDGAPDADDCDPQSSTLGLRLIEDDLATAKGAIAAAAGFSQTAWTHSGGAFRQKLVRDEGDASLFDVPADGDVVIEATAAMTKTGSFDVTERQTFVVVGARSDAGSFSAYGCGVELLGDYAQTSIVKLSGSPDAIRTATLKHDERDYLEVGEDFDISVRVAGEKITCTVTQSTGTTTLVATTSAPPAGAVGFFTRQAAAAFKDARICRVGT